MKSKRAELSLQVDISQVVSGSFICSPIRLMSENPAIYLKRLRMTRQLMLSYRPFTSQMSTICFLKLSFGVSDTEDCLRETGHQAGRMVLGLSQQAVTSGWLFPIAIHFGLPSYFIK